MNSKKNKSREKLKNARPPDFGETQYNSVMDCKKEKLWNLFAQKLRTLFPGEDYRNMEKNEFIIYYNDWKTKHTCLSEHMRRLHKELMESYESQMKEYEVHRVETKALEELMVARERMFYDINEGLMHVNDTFLIQLKLLEDKEESRNTKEYIKLEREKVSKRFNEVCEYNLGFCTQEFLDNEEYATDFKIRKPRESVVLKVEVAVQEIIEEDENLEVLQVENYPTIQILQIQDEYIDEEICNEVTDLHFQNDGQKIVTFDVEPDIKYLIEKMDEDNENLIYDFTFLELEGKNLLNDGRIISGQLGYISDED